MGRPETWTAAALVVIGVGIALWLASGRPPATPSPPGDPIFDLVAFGPVDAARPDGFGAISRDPGTKLGIDGLSCGPSLRVEPMEAGWVRAVVTAPCRQGDVLTITYGSIVFDAMIDNRGLFFVRLPVLSNDAVVTASFFDGETQDATVPNNTPGQLVGLAWKGPAVLRLVVNEYGRMLGTDVAGAGQVIRYGSGGGRQAMVYVAPTGGERGSIRVGVDVRAGKACGTDLMVTTFDTLVGRPVHRDVTIQLSDCGSIPARFVLEDLIDDLGVLGSRG